MSDRPGGYKEGQRLPDDRGVGTLRVLKWSLLKATFHFSPAVSHNTFR